MTLITSAKSTLIYISREIKYYDSKGILLKGVDILDYQNTFVLRFKASDQTIRRSNDLRIIYRISVDETSTNSGQGINHRCEIIVLEI